MGDYSLNLLKCCALFRIYHLHIVWSSRYWAIISGGKSLEIVIAWCLGILTTSQAYQGIGASVPPRSRLLSLFHFVMGRYTRPAVRPCILRPSFSDYCFLTFLFLLFLRISSVSIWSTFLLFLSPSVALMVFGLGR